VRALRRLGAAAAVCLLASACDYWHNLVGEKTITKTRLALVVRDAWTRDPISGAECGDESRSLRSASDGQGRIEVPDAGTGAYAVTCSAQYYYPASKPFAVGVAGAEVTVYLARRGGSEWYPDDTARQIRFPASAPLIRFPGHVRIATLPADSIGIFRYEWSFRENPRFNQPITAAKPGVPNLDLVIDPRQAPVPEADEATVVVYADLLGPDSLYVVGTYTMNFAWVRNKLPTFTLINTPPKFPHVGCQLDQPLSVHFSAMDSDGTCEKVVFFTRDSNSSLGPVHVEKQCSDKKSVPFPLTNAVDAKGRDQPDTVDNKLYVEVWDDNQESRLDSITFQTIDNVLPAANGGRVNPRPAYFRNSEVRAWIEGLDADGPVYEFQIDWGDGTPRISPPLKDDNTHSLRDTVSHVYRDTGTYTITNYVFDNCPDTAFYVFPERDRIRVRDNTKPKIYLDTLGYSAGDSLLFKISLTIVDRDIDDDIDSLKEVIVDWGEGPSDTLSTRRGISLTNETRSHRYLTKPRDGSFYKMRVQATDSQNGLDLANRLIPEYKP
jgi:hypothetical protein